MRSHVAASSLGERYYSDPQKSSAETSGSDPGDDAPLCDRMVAVDNRMVEDMMHKTLRTLKGVAYQGAAPIGRQVQVVPVVR